MIISGWNGFIFKAGSYDTEAIEADRTEADGHQAQFQERSGESRSVRGASADVQQRKKLG